jgi:hypothetical protein
VYVCVCGYSSDARRGSPEGPEGSSACEARCDGRAEPVADPPVDPPSPEAASAPPPKLMRPSSFCDARGDVNMERGV